LTCIAESSVHFPASARCPAGFPGRGGPGKAGAVMAGAAVWESVTLAGRAERARAARAFVSGVLGPAHPCGDVAVLLVSEVFGNSVRHSGSGAPGETVTVAVMAGDGVVRVEVTDRAGPGTPELRPAIDDTEGGRGLQLVAGLAALWGWRRRGGRMVTWFELRAKLH
jgi:anti-sigma regulatory factor (Ser/Thr protein kinase)